MSFGGEVLVHQFNEAGVVAAVLGAGPIAAVDEAFRPQVFPQDIEDAFVVIDFVRRWLGNAALIESGNPAPDVFVLG